MREPKNDEYTSQKSFTESYLMTITVLEFLLAAEVRTTTVF